MFGPNVVNKYPSAVTTILDFGCNSRLCSAGYFLITNPSFVSCLQELEQIEEHYKQETRDLLSTVKRLQDENRKLASSLAAATERDSAFSEDGKFQFCFVFAQLGQIEKTAKNRFKKIREIDGS